MDAIRAQKIRLDDGKYNLSIDVLDTAYFNAYSNVDRTSGEEFLREYLNSSADDADYCDVDIKHNKASHIVKITAQLNYAPNNHKVYEDRHKLM